MRTTTYLDKVADDRLLRTVERDHVMLDTQVRHMKLYTLARVTSLACDGVVLRFPLLNTTVILFQNISR